MLIPICYLEALGCKIRLAVNSIGWYLSAFSAGVAQLVEQGFRKAGVGSSTLPFGSIEKYKMLEY